CHSHVSVASCADAADDYLGPQPLTAGIIAVFIDVCLAEPQRSAGPLLYSRLQVLVRAEENAGTARRAGAQRHLEQPRQFLFGEGAVLVRVPGGHALPRASQLAQSQLLVVVGVQQLEQAWATLAPHHEREAAGALGRQVQKGVDLFLRHLAVAVAVEEWEEAFEELTARRGLLVQVLLAAQRAAELLQVELAHLAEVAPRALLLLELN